MIDEFIHGNQNLWVKKLRKMYLIKNKNFGVYKLLIIKKKWSYKSWGKSKNNLKSQSRFNSLDINCNKNFIIQHKICFIILKK